ncbi:MAG: RNHCP domain-containing protein [bacterium]
MKKINETFICVHCSKAIPQAEKTCRNHCPYCFVSLHVDGDIPGDRNTQCHGKMYPTTYEIKNGGMKILFVCSKCGKKHWNKRADDDEASELDEYIKNYRKSIMSD